MLRNIFLSAVLSCGLAFNSGSTWSAEPNSADIATANADLTEFVEKVLASNPRLNAAFAAIDSRAALRDAADRPLYNPELFLDAENAKDDSRAIGVSQSFDWANKRESRTAVAESQRLAAEAEYHSIRWNLSIELLSGLAQNQAARDRLNLAEQRQALMQDFADLARRRFNAGDLAQVELDLAQLSLIDAQILKATVASQLAEARQSIRNLVPDSRYGSLPELSSNFPVFPIGLNEPQLLVRQLPRVLATEMNVEAVRAQVELRQRERRPDPTLSLAAGKEDDESLVGLNLSIPLFVRNNFSNEVIAASADLVEAEQLYTDTVQRAVSRFTSASERYRSTSEAWSGWEMTGQASLSRQTELLQRLWEAGELSTTDYLVQLRQTLDVRENAVDLWETLWLAWFEWLLASGQLDTWLGASHS